VDWQGVLVVGVGIEFGPFNSFVIIKVGEPLASEFPDKEADDTQYCNATSNAETNN